MEETLRVLVLAVVQGIAEFLPISSSGHLVIVDALWSAATGKKLENSDGLELEVALHAGTLVSILAIYFHDLLRLLRQPRLCALVIVGSVPAAVVGLGFKDWFEAAFQSPLAAGCGLLITSLFLTLGQKFESSRYDEDNIPWLSVIVIGCFQAIAIFPGISRSGSTITGGLLTGVNRLTATKFSFLLAIPAIGGATLLTLKDVVEAGQTSVDPGLLIMGAVVSAVVGYFSLQGLLRIVTARRLHWFAGYCFVAGSCVIAWQLLS